ncbi:unnamed protein product [Amoebophrya sp. A120]|nr:unnamed protein product [Amoebophrya sp. A120]|eukprot:GSA120T00014309001.1
MSNLFKKAASIDGATKEKIYGGKETKQIADFLKQHYPADTASIKNKKTQLILKTQNIAAPDQLPGSSNFGFLTTCNDQNEQEYLYIVPLDAKGVNVELNYKPKLGFNNFFFPTLFTLWRHVESPAHAEWRKFSTANLRAPPVGADQLQVPADAFLPTIFILDDVSHFILKGSDVFAPGLCVNKPQLCFYPETTFENQKQLLSAGAVKKGSLVEIKVEGNPFAIAVGVWQLEVLKKGISSPGAGAAGNNTHLDFDALKAGTAVKILHRFGDCLWQKFPKNWLSPPGFSNDRVDAIFSKVAGRKTDGEDGVDDQKVDSAPSKENARTSPVVSSPGRAAGSQPEEDDDDEDGKNKASTVGGPTDHDADGGAGDRQVDSCSDSATEDQPQLSKREQRRLEMQAKQSGTTPGSKKNKLKTAAAPQLQNDQVVLTSGTSKSGASRSNSNTPRGENKAGNENINDYGGEKDSDEAPVSAPEMDQLLTKSFLQALKLQQPQIEKQLPIDLNTFYANFLRPNRPNNTSVDVKKSSGKKLKPFFEKLDAEYENLISFNKDKTKALKFNFKHPAVKDHALHEKLSSDEVPGGALFPGASNSSSSTAPTNLRNLSPGQLFASLAVTNSKLGVCQFIQYEEVFRVPSSVGEFVIAEIATACGREEEDLILKNTTTPSTSSNTSHYVKQKSDFQQILKRFCEQKNLSTSKKMLNLSTVPRLRDSVSGYMAASNTKKQSGATSSNVGGGSTSGNYLQSNAAKLVAQQDFVFDEEDLDAFPTLEAGGDQKAMKGRGPAALPGKQKFEPQKRESTSPRGQPPAPVVSSLTFESFSRLLWENCVSGEKHHRIVTMPLVQTSARDQLQIAYKNGKLPKIQVRTEKRMNHNCTLIQGLSKYYLDLDKVLAHLKQHVLKSTSGQVIMAKDAPTVPFEILLQGFYDVDCYEFLTQDLKIPESAVENLAESRKKDMRQKVGAVAVGRKNVVKS